MISSSSSDRLIAESSHRKRKKRDPNPPNQLHFTLSFGSGFFLQLRGQKISLNKLIEISSNMVIPDRFAEKVKKTIGNYGMP